MDQQNITQQNSQGLNNFIHVVIESNGMDFTAEHYMELRDQYYVNQQYPSSSP